MTATTLGTVTVCTNGTKKDVPLSDGLTVSAALDAAEIRPGVGSKTFVNGEPAEKNSVLQAGDTVTVAPRVKNG